MIHLRIDETDVNRLAQRFYEDSGISLPSMTDKPKIVAGLRSVFEALGIQVATNPPVTGDLTVKPPTEWPHLVGKTCRVYVGAMNQTIPVAISGDEAEFVPPPGWIVLADPLVIKEEHSTFGAKYLTLSGPASGLTTLQDLLCTEKRLLLVTDLDETVSAALLLPQARFEWSPTDLDILVSGTKRYDPDEPLVRAFLFGPGLNPNFKAE